MARLRLSAVASKRCPQVNLNRCSLCPHETRVGVEAFMDEQRSNLHDFLNEVSSFSADEMPVAPVPTFAPRPGAIGIVTEIAGSGSQIRLDAATVAALQ